MRKLTIIAIVLLAGGLANAALCAVSGYFFLRKPHPIVIKNWQGGLVQRDGEYTTPKGLTLLVSTDELVHVSLSDPSGRTLLSNSLGSVYHRWVVCFDQDQRVWYHNSDVGTFVWVPSADGSYTETSLQNGDPMIKLMPRIFYDKLGSLSQLHFYVPDSSN